MKRKLELVAAVLGSSAAIAGVAVAASSPSVVTGKASHIGQHGAVLNGTVNPNGSSTTYFFQWGLTNAYGVNGKPHSAGAGTVARAVAETAAGLIPGTTYHYRLVATNAVGTSVGADHAFTTAGHPPPAVATGPATALSSSGATLTGVVNPAGEATTWWFQWGASTSYGQETAHQPLAAGAAPQNVASSLHGLLAAGTIYHFRLVATHAGSATSVGSDQSFLTYPSPPPTPNVSASTTPRHPRHRPYFLNTVGSIAGPTWMPAQYACAGNVTIRFFRGVKQVAFTLAGVQPNCQFSAQTVFNRLPGRHPHAGERLRVVIRFVHTPYLATNRAAYEHVTLG
jgi:hypothetical protein